MSILETRMVTVYDFENRDGETKYGFVMKFQEQDDVYTPYLTNSRAAIGLFIDPIDFAELIQDEHSKYTITPNAIVFEDKVSAEIAADVLYEQLRNISIRKVESTLYDFAKANHFGKKQEFIEAIATRIEVDPEHVSDEELQNEFDTYVAAREDILTANTSSGNFNIVHYDIATGILTADNSLTFKVEDIDLTY